MTLLQFNQCLWFTVCTVHLRFLALTVKSRRKLYDYVGRLEVGIKVKVQMLLELSSLVVVEKMTNPVGFTVVHTYWDHQSQNHTWIWWIWWYIPMHNSNMEVRFLVLSNEFSSPVLRHLVLLNGQGFSGIEFTVLVHSHTWCSVARRKFFLGRIN